MIKMKGFFVPIAIAITLVGASATPSMAGGFYSGGFGVYNGFGYGRFHNPRFFYNGFYGRGFNRGFHGRRFHRRGLNGAEAAIIGVGAGLATLAIVNSQRAAQPQTVIVRESTVLAPGSARSYPEPPFNPSLPPAGQPTTVQPGFAQQGFNQQGGAASCLQVREYQTTITIGGVERDAYGSACLQPDGSWLQGPPIVAPFAN